MPCKIDRAWMRNVFSGLISRAHGRVIRMRFHVGKGPRLIARRSPPGWLENRRRAGAQGLANFSLLHHLTSFRLLVSRRQYMAYLKLDVTKLAKPTITAYTANQHFPDDDQVLDLIAKPEVMAVCTGCRRDVDRTPT